MKDIKKIAIIICAALLCFSLLTGCTKLVNSEQNTVEVEIVSSYHRPAYVQMIYTGKSFVPISHPAVWSVTVEYDGKQYTVNDYEAYQNCNEKDGETVDAVLETRTYENNSVKYAIISLA